MNFRCATFVLLELVMGGVSVVKARLMSSYVEGADSLFPILSMLPYLACPHRKNAMAEAIHTIFSNRSHEGCAKTGASCGLGSLVSQMEVGSDPVLSKERCYVQSNLDFHRWDRLAVGELRYVSSP
jgi:hypothetical protein